MFCKIGDYRGYVCVCVLQKWKEDSGPSPLQHPFRSADRLHVQPREVSRKLSSTSEYAVITYSTDADL